MDEPSMNSSSFTALATIPLAKPHVLHPDACNPTMDLVALLLETDPNAAGAGAPTPSWRKPNAKIPITTKVALWRMSGSKVWEVDVGGRILGLTWSRDGTYLSLLVLRFDAWPETPDEAKERPNRSTVEHLAVHTGEVVKAVPVPPTLFEGTLTSEDWARTDRDPRAEWWPMAWVEGAEEWPAPKPGSSLMMIDVLSRVTPVDPPKPAIINPFAPAAKTEVFKTGMNPALATFPALLPTIPLMAPDVLVLSCRQPQPGRPSVRLLTGTFPLAQAMPVPPPSISLALAQRTDALERFLDVILRGVNACEMTFRESEKQTMIWREELEECGQQQDMTVADVHADLFRFLMAGRCGSAVNEWMGNRMTNRTLTKWESTLATAFSTIQKVIHQSITPAVERILLILTELDSWASDISELDIVLDQVAIKRGVEISKGMAMLVETMRLDAETEYAAADEWCKWLRYEMARAAGSADDAPALPSHDLKLVWSFMKNGFVGSRFRQHFPHVPEAKEDILPSSVPSREAPVPTDLDAVMRATMAQLTSPSAADTIPSPLPVDRPHGSFSTFTDSPPRRNGTPEPFESPDTMASPTMHTDPPIVRQQELEPWSWANGLVSQCREIITSVQPRDPMVDGGAAPEKASMPGVLVGARVIGDEEWVVSMVERDHLNILVLGEDAFRLTSVSTTGPLLQAAFFDDDELAIVFQTGAERYLATATIATFEEMLTAPIQRGTIDPAQMFQSLIPSPLTLARCHALGTTRHEPRSEPWLLALNGREGRKTGCVLTRGGAEVEVLDMADGGDEEEEEGEEEEGDVEMEDSEA